MLSTARAKLKNYLDRSYPHWDLSIALRYLPIVDALKSVPKSHTVLEAGSEISGITPYLPRPVTGLDRGFDYSRQNKWLKPVEGSATAMPFADNSFDYSLCVDMLEHLPASQRAKAFSELLRVTKRRVFLSFPCGQASEAVDRELDEYFYKKNGRHFDYLEEHVKLGLPSCQLVKKLAAKYPNWQLTAKGNTSLWLWKLMLKLGLSNQIHKTSLYHRLLLLLPLLKHLNFPPTYRKLYILTRQ